MVRKFWILLVLALIAAPVAGTLMLAVGADTALAGPRDP
jgi:hypothetical protein